MAAPAALRAQAGKTSGSQDRDDDPTHPQVHSLTLAGVHAVDPSELRLSIATEASHCLNTFAKPFCAVTHAHYFYQREYLDRTEFRRDVLRILVFYWKRGYRDAQVDTAVVPYHGERTKVDVTFKITEGPPTVVSAVQVKQTGDSVLSQRDAAGKVVIDTAAPLNLFKIDTSVVNLKTTLWDRGYADAAVDTAVAVDTAAHRAIVTINIDPKHISHVGTIDVEGNEKVSTRTIRNSLSIHTGDVFKRSEMLNSQRRLFESGLFRRATFALAPSDSTRRDGSSASAAPDTIKNLVVNVVEAALHAWRTSVGFNTVDYFQTEGRYTRYNFFGGARRLDLSAGAGNLLAPALQGRGIFRSAGAASPREESSFLRPTWIASADFLQPWFRSPKNSISLGLFGHRRSVPGVVIDRGYGATGTFTRELMDRTPGSATYHFEVSRVEASDVYFCITAGVCDPPTVASLRGNQKLSPLTITVAANRANDPLAPSAGYQGHIDLEHASSFTLSDYRYNRAFAEYATYRRLLSSSVLAGRVRVGWVGALASTGQAVGIGTTTQAVLHPRTRFYAGGSRSVRGVGENQLGPRVLTIGANRLRGLVVKSGTNDTTYLYCPPTTPITECNPNAMTDTTSLSANDFVPRPLGGTTLLEGSVELRFPIWQKMNLGGAVFLDGGIVGRGSLATAAQGDAALTPGFGLRYYSPVGPIRIDFGFNPSRAEDLPVVTEVTENGQQRLVQLKQTRSYSVTGTHSGILGVLNRLTLHLSIGEAY